MTDQTCKYDAEKPKPSLVPTQIIRDIARVRAYGNAKYDDADSWRGVDPQRYIDALYRHMLDFEDNPMSKDAESGIEHYKHIACNVAFLCEILKSEEGNKPDKAPAKWAHQWSWLGKSGMPARICTFWP